MILWTRRPYAAVKSKAVLTVEVAEDEAFSQVVAVARATVSAQSDWTARVLVGRLQAEATAWMAEQAASDPPQTASSNMTQTVRL